MDPKYYRFTIVHHGYSLVIRLNDVIIDTDPQGVFRNRNFINNQYILDGKNTLTIEIGLAGDLPKDLTLQCTVQELTETDIQNNATPKPVLVLEFPGKQAPSFPAQISGEFKVESPFGRWQWEDAETLEMTPEAAADLTGVIEKLHQALSSKDLASMRSIVDVKTREMAKAFYVDPAERLKDQEKFFSDIFSDSQFGMEPLKTDDLDIVPMARNRLFFVRHKGGGVALESKELSEGYNFSLPVIAAKVSGKWSVVR